MSFYNSKKIIDGDLKHGLEDKQTLRRLLGLTAPYITLIPAALGEGFHPVHVRVEAPAGLVIDDAVVFSESKPVTKGLELQFHHARVSILDRSLPVGSYTLRLKVNPKRTHFLIPAAIVSAVIAILGLIAIFVGPEVLASRHDLSAAMFIVPTLAGFFTAKESEHELVSAILKFPRIGIAIASFAATVAGALIATMDKNASMHSSILLKCLIVTVAVAASQGLPLVFQIARIGFIRKITLSSSNLKSRFAKLRLIVIAALPGIAWLAVFVIAAGYLWVKFGRTDLSALWA